MQIDIESSVIRLPSLHLQANGSGLSLSRQKPAPTPANTVLKIGSDPQCKRTWRMSHKWRRWIGTGLGWTRDRRRLAARWRGKLWQRQPEKVPLPLLPSWVEHWRTEINPPVHLSLADHDLVTLKCSAKRKGTDFFKETKDKLAKINQCSAHSCLTLRHLVAERGGAIMAVSRFNKLLLSF